jgi:hypothetical protein
MTLIAQRVFADCRHVQPKCFPVGDLHHSQLRADCKLPFFRRPRRSKVRGVNKTLVTNVFSTRYFSIDELHPGISAMNCQKLAGMIQQLQPTASPQDVARLCLLISNNSDRLGDLNDETELRAAWSEMGLKLQAATDQHAAMTYELEELASSDPEKFSKDQIWVLIRAIKVQSQVLQMYVGQPVLDI